MVIKKKIIFSSLNSSVLIFFLINLLFIPEIYSQKLVTDRPDQTESAVTVPLNSLQIETGFLYEGVKETESVFDNYSIGALLRYGILDNIELRFGGDYLIGKVSGLSVLEYLSG